MTKTPEGHSQPTPSDDDLNFDDVKDLRREAPDVDLVMQRAREKFTEDLTVAPTFAPFGRKRALPWVAGAAVAAAAATVFAFANPWGDNTTKDHVVLTPPTPTSTATATTEPDRTLNPDNQTATTTPTVTASPGTGSATSAPTPTAQEPVTLDWRQLGNRTGFTTHNRAVHCRVDAAQPGEVYCGAQNPTFTVTKKPSWCEEDWVDYISASTRKAPSFTCLSDAYVPFADSHEALPKVATVALPGGAQCTVNNSTVSCSFKGRNKFTLAPGSYRGVKTPQNDPDGGENATDETSLPENSGAPAPSEPDQQLEGASPGDSPPAQGQPTPRQ